MFRPVTLVLAWVLVVPGVSLAAEQFVSPKGFSLRVPDKWRMASEDELTKTRQGTAKITGADPAFAALILGPPSDSFAPNVPGKNSSYVVNCTALASQWAEAYPKFKSVLESLKVDVPPGK